MTEDDKRGGKKPPGGAAQQRRQAFLDKRGLPLDDEIEDEATEAQDEDEPEGGTPSEPGDRSNP